MKKGDDVEKQEAGSKTTGAKKKEIEKQERGASEESADRAPVEGKRNDETGPSFGVKSYHHQFYAPQPVKNPDLYEFPKMNLVDPDEEENLKKNGYCTVNVVIILALLLMIIISGVTLCLQYVTPHLWKRMIAENESLQLWTFSGFFGCLLIIAVILLFRLMIFIREAISKVAKLWGKESYHQAPSMQGTIPLISEIQAIQPPKDSLSPNVE